MSIHTPAPPAFERGVGEVAQPAAGAVASVTTTAHATVRGRTALRLRAGSGDVQHNLEFQQRG
ncbi:MAG: hypothetical protein ACRDTN_08780, partial [Mycobacterium sp.]